MAFVYISQLILKLRASAQWAAVRAKLEEKSELSLQRRCNCDERPLDNGRSTQLNYIERGPSMTSWLIHTLLMQ